MIGLSPLLITFVAAFGIRSALEVVLNRLNVSHLRRYGQRIPPVFRSVVDEGKLARISAYRVESMSFGLFADLFSQSWLLAALLSGFLPRLVERIEPWVTNPVWEGLIFFAVLSAVLNLPRIPFNFYEIFVIEERHGFNTRTIRTWLLDLLKETLLSALLGGIVLLSLLILIYRIRQAWWIWAWLVLALVEGLVLWLYPVLIAPWFNRFEPVSDASLQQRIQDLVEVAGLTVKGVYQMDAGKRTRHTNAYFTGLGRTKRIVLFDSLLERHTEDEILAILCHEVGHWKRKHMIKQLLALEIASFVVLFVTGRLIQWPLLYRTFGFHGLLPFVGVFLVGTVVELAGYFLYPLGSAISRTLERQADDEASRLMGTGLPLARALRRLALDNLANLNPHPLYAWFYYTHPPVVERIERLERNERETS
ncbi:MAG: M48 family metallopeptidase [Deltaproteobacteria bacterium]|nr:M48 family metallopeptidase [Deltaproteobacteria bacterium]MBW2121520.1 M48 family metallopeptidase [Deltaproteobacteria bacterium]